MNRYAVSIVIVWAIRWNPGVFVGACLAVALSSASLHGQEPAPPQAAAPENPSDAPAPQAMCRPDCRSGFVCIDGACVSRCNPPCPARYLCTDAGACVAEPQAPPALVPPAAMQQAPGSAPAVETGPAAAPAPERSGVVGALRIGVLVVGSGESKTEVECVGDMTCSEPPTVEYDDRSRLLLELDGMLHVLPRLRLGLGGQFVPNVEIKGEESSSTSGFGQEVALVAIVEGVFGAQVAGTVRGILGPRLLFADDELQDSIDALEQLCAEADETITDCTVARGPFLGVTLGAAGGVLAMVSPSVGLRADLALQYQWFPGPVLEVSDSTGAWARVASYYSGVRFWLSGGVEF